MAIHDYKDAGYRALIRLTPRQRSLLDRMHAASQDQSDLSVELDGSFYDRYLGAIDAIANDIDPDDPLLAGRIQMGHYEADQSRGTGEEEDYRERFG